jgi:phosphatidylserine/phosphatidylglycerophosphate/cardiolipin synthase-like enzyme
MVLVDYGTPNAAAYVGSVNLSTGSMNNNRELGIIVREPAIMETLYSLFMNTDWPATAADDKTLCSQKCQSCK